MVVFGIVTIVAAVLAEARRSTSVGCKSRRLIDAIHRITKCEIKRTEVVNDLPFIENKKTDGT